MPVYFLDEKNVFPDPMKSDPSGLLAIGGDLSVERLLLAYKMGIFPWYSEDQPILWFSPDPRLIINLNDYKPSKSLLKIANSGKFKVKADLNFQKVIENCAIVRRFGQSGTWITSEMKNAYVQLHNKGYAHSFETYLENELVGGLYGVSLGGAFFGESMFHVVSNASKVAFYHLVQKCIELNIDFIDSQIPTDHMKNLGGKEIPREEFLRVLKKSLKKKTVCGKWNIKEI
ncbi:MAG: leucyl/phenylalanyl-tRNA--protein transferase [Candidatus Dadabacteria bacterium]|nr:leucyl/phenylalanyl-tRNA--protein transferase [Candidatus Dadabacteria bacterium]NIQ15780.1 leucyl/phenylalanyl-tRNA--protein transferase [Candidatus Dadabacteria bacterium]